MFNQPIEPQDPASFTPYSNDSEFIVRGMNQIISRTAIANLRRKYFSEMPKRIQAKGLHSGALPWGYKKPAGRETDPDAVPVQDAEIIPHLIHAKDMLLAGRSTYQIVAELERLGVPPPKTYLRRSTRTSWDATTIRRILSNPYYAGDVRWGVTKSQTNLRETFYIQNSERLSRTFRAGFVSLPTGLKRFPATDRTFVFTKMVNVYKPCKDKCSTNSGNALERFLLALSTQAKNLARVVFLCQQLPDPECQRPREQHKKDIGDKDRNQYQPFDHAPGRIAQRSRQYQRNAYDDGAHEPAGQNWFGYPAPVANDGQTLLHFAPALDKRPAVEEIKQVGALLVEPE